METNIYKQFVRMTWLGPVYLVRSVYADGRICWGVSEPGGCCLLGSDIANAIRLAEGKPVQYAPSN